MRFWRNTTVATLAGRRDRHAAERHARLRVGRGPRQRLPPGRACPALVDDASTAPTMLLDYGSTYGPGTATHSLTLYRHASGALSSAPAPSSGRGASTRTTIAAARAADAADAAGDRQPARRHGRPAGTLQAGLSPPPRRPTPRAPTSTITSPAQRRHVAAGHAVTITGTATDTGGGMVGGVEVSTDGGATWQPATGTATLELHVDAGGVGHASRSEPRRRRQRQPRDAAARACTITVARRTDLPCTIWTPTHDARDRRPTSDPARSSSASSSAPTSTASSPASGSTRAPATPGTHVGHLWTSTGTLLATATFTGETASGWQQVNFATPVAITANTTYVASYHAPNGHYSATDDYFAPDRRRHAAAARAQRTASTAATASTATAPSGFPTGTFQPRTTGSTSSSTRLGGAGRDGAHASRRSTTPAAGATGIGRDADVTATFSEAMGADEHHDDELRSCTDPGGNVVPAAVTYDAATHDGDPQSAVPRSRTPPPTPPPSSGGEQRASRTAPATRWRPTRRGASPPRRPRRRPARARSGRRPRRRRRPPRRATPPRSRSA